MTLTRYTPLRRTAMRRRKTVALRLALRDLQAAREVVIARSGGNCERCGDPGADVHHRRPRGAGGSRSAVINSPANLVLACRPCHTTIESHRLAAVSCGWLLSAGSDPERIAILRYDGQWVRLTSDGSYEDATEAQ